MPCPGRGAGATDNEWGEKRGLPRASKKTSGPLNRCANRTIWRSVSADRSLCGKGPPRRQHGSRAMTDQAVKPRRDRSERVREVGRFHATRLNDSHSNNAFRFCYRTPTHPKQKKNCHLFPILNGPLSSDQRIKIKAPTA